MARVERVSCGRMDHGGCGLLVRVEDGKVTGVRGDPDAPTRGYVCRKALAYPERLHHPERLRYPKRRTGPKGGNGWKRISWDDALGEIAERLTECRERRGAERALFLQGTPKGLENLLLYRFAHAFESPNVAATGTVCFAPRLGASLLTTGFYPHPDLEHPPELLLSWGANHPDTSADGILAPEFRAALGEADRVLRIDPVNRDRAGRGTWLRVRPGADGPLALALIKVIVEEGLYDPGFVERWTVGFEELRSHLQGFSLGELARQTWVPAEEIREAARLYAGADSASVVWGNALDHTVNSVQTARALLILMALTGNLDRPGGNLQAALPRTVRPRDFMLMDRFRPLREKMIGKEFKLSALLGFVPYHRAVKSILEDDPFRIEAAYLQGTNPLAGYPNSPEVFEALRKVPFLAVADLFMTPTARLADIVLPAATHFEFDDLGYFGLPFGKLFVRRKIVDPPGECRSDVRIINDLAARLGLGNLFWKDERACIDHILEPSGFTMREAGELGALSGEKAYRKYERDGFPTKSGKVELFSSWMEENGYPPLPVFAPLPEKADGETSFTFTSAKVPVYFHSMNRNLPSLRRVHPDPLLQLHPEPARRIGVDDGDWLWVETARGKIRARAKLRNDLDPRVVLGEHGWWFPERDPEGLHGWNESNVNVLTESDPPYEPCLGTVNLRGFPCRLRRA